MNPTHDSQSPTRTATRSALADQSNKVAEDVRELGHMALHSAGETMQSVKETVKERGSETLEHGRERLSKAREGLEGYMFDHPVKSVLIAAGIGAVIGIGLRSRH